MFPPPKKNRDLDLNSKSRKKDKKMVEYSRLTKTSLKNSHYAGACLSGNMRKFAKVY